MRPLLFCWIVATTVALAAGAVQAADLGLLNHGRSMLDAHNCYPDDGRWNDRIQRALQSGYPVSIEQDLAWYVDPKTGEGRVVVSHTAKPSGTEPSLREYFFEQVRPIVEKALADNKRDQWPLIVLHFDFKDNQPAILQATWKLLGEYEPWLSTAGKTDDANRLSPIDRKPILVLTEDSDAQAKVFFDDVPVGGRLRLFGSAHSHEAPKDASREARAHWEATAPPENILTEAATNYRRWWNNSWSVVEEGGQRQAGEWTVADNRRLRALVDRAHKQGLWIRFYTLDGVEAADNKGWGESYNFGSPDKVIPRWEAAVQAGVDLIATDQYEVLARYVGTSSPRQRPAADTK